MPAHPERTHVPLDHDPVGAMGENAMLRVPARGDSQGTRMLGSAPTDGARCAATS